MAWERSRTGSVSRTTSRRGLPSSAPASTHCPVSSRSSRPRSRRRSPRRGARAGSAPGYSPELDALESDERLALIELEALERSEQERSGIRTLKIGYNQVFGYYFEISRAHLAKAPVHLRRKQTLAGGERFTSDDLEAIEGRILQGREERRRVESEAWEGFLAAVEAHVPALYRLARTVGEVDAFVSFAWVAVERGHVRPIVDDSGQLTVREGHHPVLDRVLQGQFVPNDTELDAATARLLVLTGPNMSGKSTYMRQVGLLVVLAQAGAFVPAKFARIGVVSSLFTRMGFTDEIGRGKSSFMVEMSEVAEILSGADARSLVLLDEVGRGTSTFDGLALAWATLQYLHDTARCRTVLATHYHQLTELVERLPAARNAHLAVRGVGRRGRIPAPTRPGEHRPKLRDPRREARGPPEAAPRGGGAAPQTTRGERPGARPIRPRGARRRRAILRRSSSPTRPPPSTLPSNPSSARSTSTG